MDPEAVTKALTDFLSGNVTTHIQEGPKLIGVRVWIPRDARETMRNIENLLLRAPDGHLFPLKRVATLIPVSGEPEIMRDDLKRMVAVTARISGRDLGSTVRDVKRALARSGVIPSNVLYTFGGSLRTTADRFPRSHRDSDRSNTSRFCSSTFSLRKFPRGFCDVARSIIRSSGSFSWAMGHRHGIQHYFTHGYDDDCRYRHRDCDFLLLGISLTARQRRPVDPCRDKSDACDLDDDVRCHSRALATGAWNRARVPPCSNRSPSRLSQDLSVPCRLS